MSVSIEQLRKAAVASGIITESAFSAARKLLPDEKDSASAEHLVKLLVKQQKLTKFQAQLLYQGKGASLKLGNYIILEKLGEGGMGQVFLAEHQRMKRRVALKVLPAHLVKDKQAIERFHREAQAAARLSHPNIVTAFDADEARGMHFLVMEFVPGTDLSIAVKQTGPLSVGKAVDCLLQAAEGLKYAHEHGVIHRDIKPANLLLSTEGVVKVPDMGLARLDDGSAGSNAGLTGTDIVMGTVDYMSPEQAASTKSADARSDVYSLGCTLHFFLTAQSVYSGESLVQRILAHRDQPIPSLRTQRPDVPAVLDDLFAKMVAKRPEDRIATMSEVAKKLKAIADGSAILHPQGGDASFASDADLHRFLQQQNAAFSPTIMTGTEQAAGAAVTTRTPDKPSQAQQDTVPSGYLLNTQTVSPAAKPGQKAALKVSPADTNHWPPGKKILAAAAAGAMILLLGIIIITIRNKDGKETIVKVPDGSTTDLELPEGGTVSIRHEPAPASGGRQPAGIPSEISNFKSEISVNSAAVEWVLSLKSSTQPPTVVARLSDGSIKAVTKAAELPAGPYTIQIEIVAAMGVDDAAVAKYLKPLKSLGSLRLQDCSLITDESLVALQQSQSLRGVYLNGSPNLMPRAVVALAQSLPELVSFGVDKKQFSTELADWLATTPRVTSFHLLDGNDAQLRRLLIATHLDELVVIFRSWSQYEMRHSTWSRLPEKLPNLRALSLGYADLADSDLASICQLPKLEILALTGNRNVSDVGLAQLATASKLKFLDVIQTAVTPLGLADFLEAQPACQVVWDGADHRAVAEWVWSLGGKVQVAGRGAEWFSAADVQESSPHALREESRTLPDPDGSNDVADLATPTARPADFTQQVAGRGAEWLNAADVQESSPHALREESRTLPDPDGSNDVADLATPTARPAGFTQSVKATLRGPVLLTGVDLSGLATLQDADLARLADCTTLRDLQLYNTKLTGACLTHLLRSRSRETSEIAPSTSKPGSRSRETSENAPSTSELSRVRLQGGLPRLRVLTLAGLPIEDQDLAQLRELKQLYNVWLHSTKITDAGMPSLSGLTELETLTLKDTTVTTVGLESLKSLPKLSSLDLSNTSADDRTVELLCEFPNLLAVNLSDTQLTEAGARRLAQRALPWHRLYLSNLPNVTDAILTDLRGQQELISLDLSETSVTPAAFEAFVRDARRGRRCQRRTQ